MALGRTGSLGQEKPTATGNSRDAPCQRCGAGTIGDREDPDDFGLDSQPPLRESKARPRPWRHGRCAPATGSECDDSVSLGTFMQDSRSSSSSSVEKERKLSAPAYSCHCSLWTTNPTFLLDKGIPHGYCGLCEICSAPGHTRHFPGTSPSTGTWCEAHYRRVMWLHPLGHHGRWVWSTMAALAIGAAVLIVR